MAESLAPEAPPRRLRRHQRAEQLIDIASELFARQGFSGTTTREIAQRAGVTEAVIFRYFPRKEDLYAAILARKSDADCGVGLIDELRAAGARDDDEGVIRLVVRTLIEWQRNDPARFRLMLHSALEAHSLAEQVRRRPTEALQQFLTDYVIQGQQAGRFAPGDPLACVIAIFALPTHHNLLETLGALPGDRDDEIIDQYIAFIVRGLRR